jgi:hypothetical protein
MVVTRGRITCVIGLGQYIDVSVHRDTFSDDLWIDTRTHSNSDTSICLKIRMTKIYCLQLKVKVNSMVKQEAHGPHHSPE